MELTRSAQEDDRLLEVALMIEGQNGLTWPRWKRIARAAEDLGFAGLYRSDHFTNRHPPDIESLEMWVSLTWMASHTDQIEFGPLVTPFSFRHPVFTARMAKDVDDLSGGRLTLGVGAGWQEREHRNFGFDLLDISERMDRFEEGLVVVTRLLESDEPVDFQGSFYRLEGAVLLPRPQRPAGPPILVGGNGPKRTLPLAARYADEWNAVYIPLGRFVELNARLDALLEAHGRDPRTVRRSMMAGVVFGRDQAEVDRKLKDRNASAEKLRQRGVIVGTPSEVTEQLEQCRAAGVERIMLQWLELDDLDALEALAQTLSL